MKFTLSWLKDYLDTTASASDLAEALIGLGFEVEHLSDVSRALASFRVAHVRSVKPHPHADRLKVCDVETASGFFQVVCGAPNVRAEMATVFAPIGSTIPKSGVVLEKGVIRGVESHGMLCSGRELGVSEEDEGILDLPLSVAIGTPAALALGQNDPVFDISVTPNRPDALGVYGLARDLAAKGIGTFLPVPAPSLEPRFPCPLPVSIAPEALDSAPYFSGRVIRGVVNSASPQWLAQRLKAVGLKPVSALVDITNYICLTFCRPLHVFDCEKIGPSLHVRLAQQDEKFEGLGGKSYSLPPNTTVISDSEGIQAIAGILGGETSGCSLDTTSVFLEAAWFHPISIAQTGRSLGILSDSRARFERGVDPEFVRIGLDLATALIVQCCGGEYSDRVEVGSLPPRPEPFLFNPHEVALRTGLTASVDQIKTILYDLGFVLEESGDQLRVFSPSWRPDISEPCDLVEEICRVIGLEAIPCVPLPKAPALTRPILTLEQKRVNLMRRCLASAGLHEVVTWSFLSEQDACDFGGGHEHLKITNPISIDLSVMRPSLLPNLLNALSKNQARGNMTLGLFEVGAIYESEAPEGQKAHAAGVRCGQENGRHWLLKSRSVDVYDAKADIFALLEMAGLGADRVQVVNQGPAWYHPGRVGTLQLGPKNILGTFGELHPFICERFDLTKGRVVGFELNLSALPPPKTTRTRPPFQTSDLMPVTRDFCFVVPRDVPAERLVRAIRASNRTTLTQVTVFDIFPLEEDSKKSVALEVTLTPQTQTFTESEIEAIGRELVASVMKATGAVLRTS